MNDTTRMRNGHGRKLQNPFTPTDRWRLSKRLKVFKSSSPLTWREMGEEIGIGESQICALVHGGNGSQDICNKIIAWLESRCDQVN